MKFPPVIGLVLWTVKNVLLILAAVYSLAFLHLLIFEVAVPLVQQTITPNPHRDESFHQVEISSVGVSRLETPHDDATHLRFNLTARVTSRHPLHEMCVTYWEADVWYDGTPLGKAYFPKICVEKMSQVTATAATSTELVGLSMPKERLGGGAPVLQVEMTQATSLPSECDDPSTIGGTIYHWLWCKATLGGQSYMSPQHDATPCRIYHLTPAETSDRRFLFPRKK
ncbi:hypothetical protein ZWY2020_032869 [Hordeum vulgare]|nr:hypothetical protein ZWY2020_032869 [Hordeum vulgare]